MHNQKLFDKIRESLTDDSTTNEALDWSREEVWTRIEQKRNVSQKTIIWWPWVAAASIALLLIGSWLWQSEKRYNTTQTTLSVPNVQPIFSTNSQKLAKVKRATIQKVVVQPPTENRTNDVLTTNIIINNEEADYVVKTLETIASTTQTPDNQMNNFSNFETKTSDTLHTKPKERVLVVDIDLPETPEKVSTNDLLKTTFLERFSREARRLRTERKFDLRALDHRTGKGIWSLVAHSIVIPEPK